MNLVGIIYQVGKLLIVFSSALANPVIYLFNQKPKPHVAAD